MLGLVLIYFMGRAFYRLAGTYEKNQWVFAVLGVISYYAGTIIGGVIIGILFLLISPDAIDSTNETVLGFMALPFGILTIWLFYKYLERRWKGELQYVNPNNMNSDILDDDFLK